MRSKARIVNKLKGSKLVELIDDSYNGVIEEIDDPNFEGRIKCRVFGVFGDKNDSLGKIPTEDLPWAYPLHDIVFGSTSGSGKFSTPKIGTIVRVIFEDNIYHPRYFSIEELDDALKELIKADYKNFHSILYDSDEQLGIYYSKNSGLLLDLKGSYINIEKDGAIVIHHKNTSSVIELRESDIDVITNNAVNISSTNNVIINSNHVHANGVTVDIGNSPTYSNVNGELLMKLLLILATGLDAKLSTTPGTFAGLVTQMENLILSKSVKVSP